MKAIRREFKLRWATWKARIVATWANTVLWYERRSCIHSWRPARAVELGRICKFCDVFQPLTLEEFYVEFGERYQAMVRQEGRRVRDAD